MRNFLYNKLVIDDSPRQVDLIVVMAGRMGRKVYGEQLYERGYAPRLLLSIGRFEVSRMRKIGFPASAELESMRDRLPPDQRHFFALIDSSGIHLQHSVLLRWSTYGEVVALRDVLISENVHAVMVVSSAIHLRRVALTFKGICDNLPLRFFFCPTPEELDSIQKRQWWKRPADRKFVLSEALKLAGYTFILSMPSWAIPKLMRLRRKND